MMSNAVVRVEEVFFFFLTDTSTTEIYTLSLHDALPISHIALHVKDLVRSLDFYRKLFGAEPVKLRRSEEHTSELQSLAYLVCRLLLEKKKLPTTTFRGS